MTALEEYRALYKAWHPIPPHPHPGSVAILLIATDAAIAELLAEDERLRSTLIAVYRSPLLDESVYHDRGEDIPQDVWDVCEAIRNAVQCDKAPHA